MNQVEIFELRSKGVLQDIASLSRQTSQPTWILVAKMMMSGINKKNKGEVDNMRVSKATKTRRRRFFWGGGCILGAKKMQSRRAYFQIFAA